MKLTQIFEKEVAVAFCDNCNISFGVAMVSPCDEKDTNLIIWARMKTIGAEKRYCPFCGREVTETEGIKE